VLTWRRNVIINVVLRKYVGYFSSLNSYNFSTDINISGVGGRIGISGCRSLSHSLLGIWFELVMVENPPFCLWNFDAIYHSSRDINTSGLGGHISISGCRTHLGTLSLNSPWWKTPDWLLESNIFVVQILKRLGVIFTPKRNRCA